MESELCQPKRLLGAEGFQGCDLYQTSVGGSAAKWHTKKLYGNLFAGQMWAEQGTLSGKSKKKKEKEEACCSID